MRRLSSALAAVACLAFAGPGHAAQLLKATLTGSVGAGSFDFDNRFGFGAGFNVLDAKPFTLTIIYDPTLGNVVNLGPTGEGRRGGTTFAMFNQSTDNPILDASVSLAGGNTINFDPDQRSEIRALSGIGFQWSFQDTINGGPAWDDLFTFTASFAGDGHLNSTLPLTNATGGGLLTLRNTSNFDRVRASLVLGTVKFETYSTAPPPPPPGPGVPEPAAWALMLIGFGGVGGAIRARRRTLTTA